MKYNLLKNTAYLFGIIVAFAALSFSSCLSPKKVVYFNDLPDSASTPIIIKNTTKFIDPTIEPNDLLSIFIQTSDMNMSGMGGMTGSGSNSNSGSIGSLMGGSTGSGAIGGSSGGMQTNSLVNSYLVDKNGNIELYLIGFVHVGGYTTAEAREIIKQKAREYYRDPVVNLRISNFDITILGSVGSPGIITSNSEKINILDAIALSTDIPLNGKRKNVLLIRSEKDDEKKVVRYDFTSAKLFQSPYYYLKQRDIIYVEPTKYAVQTSDNTFLRDLGIVTSVISFLALIYVYSKVH